MSDIDADVDLLKASLLQIFMNLLTQNQEYLDNKFSVKISKDLKEQMLIICNKCPELFNGVNNSLEKIINDNKIDSKDVPELLRLLNNVYDLVSDIKKEIKAKYNNFDIYDFIEKFLHILFVLFLKNKNISDENKELLDCVVNIVSSTFDLLKASHIKIKPPKRFKLF
jgi:hypothetical protein